ncbi:MAG: hypothetical protein ACXV9O_16185, partial [Candidatus Angelobacter sp.]
NVFAVLWLAFPARLDYGHPPLFLHVAQNQRAGGEFSQHFSQESICLFAENEAKKPIYTLFGVVLASFEVTKVTESCLVPAQK